MRYWVLRDMRSEVLHRSLGEEEHWSCCDVDRHQRVQCKHHRTPQVLAEQLNHNAGLIGAPRTRVYQVLMISVSCTVNFTAISCCHCRFGTIAGNEDST